MIRYTVPTPVPGLLGRELTVAEHRVLLKTAAHRRRIIADHPELRGAFDTPSPVEIEIMTGLDTAALARLSEQQLRDLVDGYVQANDALLRDTDPDPLPDPDLDEVDLLARACGLESTDPDQTEARADQFQALAESTATDVRQFETLIATVARSGHGSGVLEYPIGLLMAAVSELNESVKS